MVFPPYDQSFFSSCLSNWCHITFHKAYWNNWNRFLCIISCVKIFKNEYPIGLVSFITKRSFCITLQKHDCHKSKDRIFSESVSVLLILSPPFIYLGANTAVLKILPVLISLDIWYTKSFNSVLLVQPYHGHSWPFQFQYEFQNQYANVNKYINTCKHTDTLASGIFTAIAVNVWTSMFRAECVHIKSPSPRSIEYPSIYLGFL